jgi:uncharacterized protein
MAVRSAILGLGLGVFAIGIVSIYESKLGLSPWDVLNQGVAKHTPLSFGTANIAIAIVILIVARRLDVRLQVGTVANALLVGTFVDLLLRIGAVQGLAHDALPVRVALLVAGILVIGLGTGFYISASLGAGPRDSLPIRTVLLAAGILSIGMGSGLYMGASLGAGPRDSLMLGITKRVRSRVGVVRTCLELGATGLGYALGGNVGIGTLAFALGIGPAVELSFALIRRSVFARGAELTPLAGARGA